MKPRYTVLTYIINDYEIIHEIKVKDPDAEYLLITDNPKMESKTWTVIYDKSLDGLSVFDKCYAIRFNCFKYCHSNICLRIDGSIGIKKSLKILIDVFENGKYDICLMPHPFHTSFIEEYKMWVDNRNYSARQAEKCINDMKYKGYDFNYRGLFQGCFSIQRRGEITDEIDKRTLKYLKDLGQPGCIERLDQIPFSYVMNTQYSYLKVLPVSEQILRSEYLQWYRHNSNKANNDFYYNIMKDDIKYMFNKPVKCLYLRSISDIVEYWLIKFYRYLRTALTK